jgi:hypothetical protein
MENESTPKSSYAAAKNFKAEGRREFELHKISRIWERRRLDGVQARCGPEFRNGWLNRDVSEVNNETAECEVDEDENLVDDDS